MDPLVNVDHGANMYGAAGLSKATAPLHQVDPGVQMFHHHHPQHPRPVDVPMHHPQHPASALDAPAFEATGSPFSSPMLRGSYSA